MKKENKFVGPIISGRKKSLVRKWAVIEKISSLLTKVEDNQIHQPLTEWTTEQIFAIRWIITQLVNMVKIMDEETMNVIPIEWVKKYRNQFEAADDYYNVIDYMLQLWEKENGSNR